MFCPDVERRGATVERAQVVAERSVRPALLGATWGSCHKRQKPQAPTPQVPIRNRQTRKVANAKGLNRNTNLA